MANPQTRLNQAVEEYLTYRQSRFAKTTVKQEG